MSVQIMNPTGSVKTTRLPKQPGLDAVEGKKVGYLFNRHGTALAFWTILEQTLETKLSPSAVHRVYKENTWAPAPEADVDRLVRETDYALVGVGA